MRFLVLHHLFLTMKQTQCLMIYHIPQFCLSGKQRMNLTSYHVIRHGADQPDYSQAKEVALPNILQVPGPCPDVIWRPDVGCWAGENDVLLHVAFSRVIRIPVTPSSHLSLGWHGVRCLHLRVSHLAM